jgi:uncharacterized protein
MKKPSETEDEYFARDEAARLARLALEKSRVLEAEERERLKQLHWMHCPKCGMELKRIEFKDIQIDRCFNCHGTWLDDGELEKVAGREPGFIDRVAAVFRRG